MRLTIPLLIASLAASAAAQRATPRATPRPVPYMFGADLSFLAQAESLGQRFKDAGVVKPGIQLFRDHGYDWIRLRVFHDVRLSPWPLPNDVPYTIALAKQAKAAGFKLLLDFHYSDTWADGDHQPMPKAWSALTAPQLVDSVERYTRETIVAFREAGVLPDMVQIGNEITPGMLHPLGKLPEHWDTFAALLKAGVRGVAAGRGSAAMPLIMIHIDRGGDSATTRAFFDQVVKRGVPFDVIGQSYYPWWHGTLLDLKENLAMMAERYRKPIVVVEVAYNWRPQEYVGKPAPFPETPDGQRAFLEAVNDVVMAAPNGLGRGVMWWEPAVAPAPGPLRSRGMFDDQNEALPVIHAFDRWTRGKP